MEAEVRPSKDDRCAECGNPVGDDWVSYRPKPGDPESLLQHFGGVIQGRPVVPQPELPRPSKRDLRYPEDLGVFFHSWCAPRVKLPDKLQDEISRVFAQAVFAHYKETVARWATVRESLPWRGDVLKTRAHVASSKGRRVFTLTRSDWVHFRAHVGELIEIDLQRTPTGSLAEAASTIASLAHRYHVHTEQIEVWRYNETDPPQFLNITNYLVLENLARRLNVEKFAEHAGSRESPELRKYLRDHVFLVKEHEDESRWAPKSRSLVRMVFMAERTLKEFPTPPRWMSGGQFV